MTLSFGPNNSRSDYSYASAIAYSEKNIQIIKTYFYSKKLINLKEEVIFRAL